MRMYDVIKKKREGFPLSQEEIEFFVKGYTDGSIPDYQVSALLMAIYFKNMNYEETRALTFAIRDSGEQFSFPDKKGVLVDKHSTGGVGDATSLVVAPVVASLGGNVCMVAGRGLGHTGGTLDKLEAIPGFNISLSAEQAREKLKKHGMVIMGQTEKMAPADKKLYALRDVTATVESIPLIASSIMGKKLAEGSDALVLDVKAGSGAFMKSYGEGQMLAQMLNRLAEDAGKKVSVLITNMDEPLGNAIGNSLEVEQAIDTLKGEGPEDFTALCLELAANMLVLSGKGDLEACRFLAEKSLHNGSAYKKFLSFVSAQGGDTEYLKNPEKLRQAKYFFRVKAEKFGVILHQDAERYGTAACLLGAGREKVEDAVNPFAGILLEKKAGDTVMAGDPIAVLYSDDPEKFQQAKEILLSGTVFGDSVPEKKPLIYRRIGNLQS